MKVNCQHCGGSGQIEHVWDERYFLLLKIIYRLAQGNFYTSTGIYQCADCGDLYKKTYNSEYAFGKTVEIYPEGSEGFPKEEAEEYQKHKHNFPKSVI